MTVKRTLPVLILSFALCGANRADSASSATPWFEEAGIDHAMVERDYPGGFGAGVVVEASAGLRILLVTPAYEDVPDADDFGPFEVIRSSTAFWIRAVTPSWDRFPDAILSQELKDFLYAGDDDSVHLSGGLNYADDPLKVESAIAQPPYQSGANNYNILNKGLNADQLDSWELFDIPTYVFQHMIAGANVWMVSDPVSATMVIGVTIDVTPVPTFSYIPPTPQPTLQLLAGTNIAITSVTGGYIVSATTAGSSAYLQVIGGGSGVYTLTHNLGYQYPSIACYTLDVTAQLIHLVDTYCPDVNYATVGFGYVPEESSILAVVSAGAGIGSGSLVVNVTQEASEIPTPLPTMVIAVNGRPGSFSGTGANSGTLDLPTYTPTQTATPVPTPTPPKINTDIGGADDLEFPLYTVDGPSLVQGIIGESSAVIDLAYRNVSDNEVQVILDEPWSYGAVRVAAARADASLAFGDTGDSTFTIDPGLGKATLCQFTDYGTDRRVFDPVDVRFVSNAETQIYFNYSPGAMVANFLIVSGTILVGDGAANSFLITHGLGHSELIVQVYEAGGDHQKMNWCDLVHSSTSTITLTFPFIPTANQYLVMWADAYQAEVLLDDLYVRLDGVNRMKVRGDQFNSNTRVWARSVRNEKGLQVFINQLGGITNFPLQLVDKSNQCFAYLGYDQYNTWFAKDGRRFDWYIDGTLQMRVAESQFTFEGTAAITKDVTAAIFFGDTVDAGYGVSKSQSGYGRTTISVWTPTPTPVPSTPTPSPTERYLPLAGGVMNASAAIDANEGDIESAHVVETTILRYRAVTVANESLLGALLQTDGSTCYWLPGGSPVAYADVKYEKTADTGNWYMVASYSDGSKDTQRLTRYGDRIAGANYLVAARLDGEIYLVRQW